MNVPAIRAYTVFASWTSATEQPNTRIISDIATEKAPLSAETPSCAKARTARERVALEAPEAPRFSPDASVHARMEFTTITIH